MSNDVASSPDDDELVVETFDNRGEWVVRVRDLPELSQGFSDKDEAILAGRELATRLGRRYVVHDHAPTGDITDPDPASEKPLEGVPSTDDDGRPVENPSG